ncbi:MAG: leucyl aminopeptidase [Actinomycetota bacterium]
MKFERVTTTAGATAADAVVVGATKGPKLGPGATEVDQALGGALSAHLERVRFKAEEGSAEAIPTFGRLPAHSILILGLGSEDAVTPEQIRRAAGTAARKTAAYRSVALDLGNGIPGALGATVEGYLLGAYQFTRYKSNPEPSLTDRVLLLGEGDDEEVRRSEVTAEATNWARDVVNEPAGARGPSEFAELARARAEAGGVGIEVLDESALAESGMHGILSDGQGSVRPPRFVILRYEPESATGFVGAVGKGITFDSGGLSLKPADAMETMKTDCSGAAAVVAAVTALPRLQPRIRVTAAIPLAENMPGGSAIKPGDVIRHYGGHTSEVLNTDAEGRLVLADALAWMAEQQPEAMIDFATLTGGMVVALGRKVSGFFANRPELAGQIRDAAHRSGERVWEMPIIDDLRREMDSEVADIKNTGQRAGSPIFGAIFLADFVGDVPWVHVDIAGPARCEEEEHYLRKGGTGVGTRLLIEWIEQRARLS